MEINRQKDRSLKIEIPELGIETTAWDTEKDICLAIGEAVILHYAVQDKFKDYSGTVDIRGPEDVPVRV